MLPHISKIKEAALDLLFPRCCVVCGKEGEFICASCLSGVAKIEPPFCSLCGKPISHCGVCSNCTANPPLFDTARAPFQFQKSIRKAIHEYKYNNLKAASGLFAELLHDYIQKNPVSADIIIPVPLHPERLKERGYNQSALLGRELGRLTGIPFSENAIKRLKYSVSQAQSTSITQRLESVSDAFSCVCKDISGAKILLVDDVATSGATLNACASVLREKGAKTINCLTIAKEI